MRLVVVISLLLAGPAIALPMCESRDWAAHEHGHRDLGHGRVAWTWSWELEGVADDLHVVDCARAEGLRARARAERMTNALPYDRRAKATRAIELAAGAPHFFRLETLADALDDIHVPSEVLALREEPCACATYYPGRFGAD